MSLETIEVVGVAFLLITPGVWFIWLLTMNYAPGVRAQYISRQFPLELTLHYLLVSVLIHSILLLLFALTVQVMIVWGGKPELIAEWYKRLADLRALSSQDFLTILWIGLGYLLAGFVVASLLAVLLRRYLLLPDALWASEIMKLLPKEVNVDVAVDVLGRKEETVKGRLISFQSVGKEGEFELLLAQVQPNAKDTLFYVPSRVIRTLHCETEHKRWIFVFPTSADNSNSEQRQS